MMGLTYARPLINIFSKPHSIPIINPILQLGKLRLREVKGLAHHLGGGTEFKARWV